MCIIIYDDRKSTETLSKKVLKRSQDKNPHGMGIMYAEGGELHIWKTMDDLKGLWKRYIAARHKKLAVALHFRKSTEGTTSEENLHPFEIRPGFAFMHNGTAKEIEKLLPDGISDTSYINTELFQKFPVGFLGNPIFQVTIENLITGGRMFFMDRHGNHTILNDGMWGARREKGVWWSKSEHLTYYLSGNNTPWVGRSNLSYGTPAPAVGLYSGDWYEEDLEWWDMTEAEKKVWEIRPYDAEKPKQSPQKKPEESKSALMPIVPAVQGPKPSKKHNLVFDYGYLGVLSHYDARLKPIGKGSVLGHQLLAIGEFGKEIPAAIESGAHKIIGTVYEITNHYTSVISELDDIHGCDLVQPDLCVYNRRWVKVSLNTADKNAVEVWAWVYRYAMPQNSATSTAVVPFGD